MSIENSSLGKNTLAVGTAHVRMNRRSFLRTSAQITMGLLLPASVFAGSVDQRHLNFYHTHTGERLTIDYLAGNFRGAVQSALEYFLRDFRTGQVHSIDPQLFDTLCRILGECGSCGTYEVISGYRSPKTNELLRKSGSGVAKKSLHMKGQAIDIRLSDRPTELLRDIAASFHNGGVGYYPGSDFVHIDTGERRVW